MKTISSTTTTQSPPSTTSPWPTNPIPSSILSKSLPKSHNYLSKTNSMSSVTPVATKNITSTFMICWGIRKIFSKLQKKPKNTQSSKIIRTWPKSNTSNSTLSYGTNTRLNSLVPTLKKVLRFTGLSIVKTGLRTSQIHQSLICGLSSHRYQKRTNKSRIYSSVRTP